jgi:hypothetical protein
MLYYFDWDTCSSYFTDMLGKKKTPKYWNVDIISVLWCQIVFKWFKYVTWLSCEIFRRKFVFLCLICYVANGTSCKLELTISFMIWKLIWEQLIRLSLLVFDGETPTSYWIWDVSQFDGVSWNCYTVVTMLHNDWLFFQPANVLDFVIEIYLGFATFWCVSCLY